MPVEKRPKIRAQQLTFPEKQVKLLGEKEGAKGKVGALTGREVVSFGETLGGASLRPKAVVLTALRVQWRRPING